MHDLLATIVLGVVLVVAAITDVRTGKVYNWWTYPAILLGLIMAIGFGATTDSFPTPWAGLAAAALAAMAVLVGLGIVAAAGGLGWGDVKLMGAVGAIAADWRVVFSGLIYTLLVAAIMALVVMIRRGLIRDTFGRIFGAAMMTAAKVKPEMPTDTPRIPFAAAMAVGGMLAAAEVLMNLQTPWAPAW